jgi:membrane protein DedA with SNARE-associated domain
VFFGRLIPGVRSLISIPAGASGMPLAQFVGYTVAGSAVWNGLLIGAGVGLGSSWERVEQYASVLDWILVGAVVVIVGLGVVRRVRRR